MMDKCTLFLFCGLEGLQANANNWPMLEAEPYPPVVGRYVIENILSIYFCCNVHVNTANILMFEIKPRTLENIL